MRDRVKSYFQDENGPYRWEWIILGMVLLIPFLSFCYIDTVSILYHEISVVDAAVHRELRQFYQLCYERVSYLRACGVTGITYATYEFPMYIILGIWGIPLFLYCDRSGTEILGNFGSVIYGKSIYIVALILGLIIVYKICRQLQIHKVLAYWCSFLFCSSILVFSSICIIGQSDILGMVFILFGILAYAKKREGQFLFWFTLSIPFKYYALFIFVPLLLLKEKKILNLIPKLMIVVSLTLLCGLPFENRTAAMMEKAEFSKRMFYVLTEWKMPFLNGNIPVLIFTLGLLCLYCYLKPEPEENEYGEYVIFIPLLAMGITFLTFNSYPYWFLHLTPYLALTMVYHVKHLKQIILLETIGLAFLVLGQFVQYWWCFEITNGTYMLLDKIFGSISNISNPILLQDFISLFGFNELAGIFYAIYAVCIIGIIWMSRPGLSKKGEYSGITLVRPYAVLRLGINAGIMYIPIALYILSALTRK
ncbi:MAG: hypothetical protein HFI30_00025 [Lachnospiraceae bacterium]|jgi:hypothetical protein|nr:hypothetical protein [Lachnospiraceae bacterium]